MAAPGNEIGNGVFPATRQYNQYTGTGENLLKPRLKTDWTISSNRLFAMVRWDISPQGR